MEQDKLFLHKLKELVLDNLANEQFSVEHLSKTVGISRSHLHRRLKKLKGLSISQYIRQIRLGEALKHLYQDTDTITEIAYKVGFNSTSYFHKCFLDHYGFPPGEARHVVQSQLQNQYSVTASDKDVLVSSNAATESLSAGDPVKHNLSTFKTIVISILVLILAGSFTLYILELDHTDVPLEKSIAVLPFINLSEDEENQHFTDGLVEDLLNRLALVQEFKVISRTSSDTYRERGIKKVSEIASELDVSYIVEGSVQRHDNKARITIQLIDAKNDKHIWFRTFDRNIADVFKVQSEIAMKVASEMSAVLIEKQVTDIDKNYTNSPRAFDFYQLGRYYWGKRLNKDYDTAIEYFEKAITQDSSYALAYAGIADTYFLKTWTASDFREMKVNRNKAETFALKALKLDPLLVEAHTVLASLYFYFDWNWAKANTTFSNALKGNPNFSTLHHRYSEYLSYVDRDLQARQHISKALTLDPLSYVVREVSSKLYLNRGEFQKAIEEAQICEDLNQENTNPLLYQFWANYMLKNDEASLNSLKKVNRVLKYPSPDSVLDGIYKNSGRDGLMRWIIQTFGHSLTKAQSYAYLGENDKALDWLEEAFDQGDRMADVPYSYYSSNLEAEPRFIKLMAKMNLPWNPDSVD